MNVQSFSLDKLVENLHSEVYNVSFTKKDGTVRNMKCTLRADYLPSKVESESTSTKKVNPDVLAVWDLEKSEWRSFRKDSVIDYHVAT